MNAAMYANGRMSAPVQSDVLMRQRPDRRMLPSVPDTSGERVCADRRVDSETRKGKKKKRWHPALGEHQGIRYLAKYRVHVCCRTKGLKKWKFDASSEDISTSGMLLCVKDEQQKELLESAKRIDLKFRIRPGSMPEGYESRVRMRAAFAHTRQNEDGAYCCGLMFKRSLPKYVYAKKGRSLRAISLLTLLLLSLVLVGMRVNSIMYFQFNKLMYLYSLITASYLLTRYLFGALYRPVPVNKDFTPGVSIIIPCFNEEQWIARTILSCINQRYPPEKLEVLVVDDCSNDSSVECIEALLQTLHEDVHHQDLRKRVRLIRQEVNKGKREALARGANLAEHDLVVFVDSDSFLDPDAIMHLVQPFQDPKMGGVTGRTDVANTYTNFITKMQSVRYYSSFRIMKAAEAYFDTVTCLSGPLSCYRKDIVLEYSDAWLKQKFMGMRATFGDDRAMTNFVLRKYRTGYQDTAICATIVPNTHRLFLKQQIRWKRSWLRETCIAASFMWRKEPLAALSFYCGFIIPILAPVIVVYNLLLVPLLFGFFPRTFLIGLVVMSMMMSMTQLLMRRSSTWLYGVAFCLYYLVILMWQMPYAWVTFWKSTWGTRMTPEDLAAAQRRQNWSLEG